MGIELRPYQVECINEIQKQAPGSYLISLATGLGKTVTFANIPRQGRMLILSHREELVRQPRKYFNCSYGIEMAGQTSHGEEVVSASVMTLVRRLHRFERDAFDIIIVDECHHAMAPTYRKILSYFKARLVLGFTATANRADKLPLGEIFEKIIYNKDLRWGIENGYLSPIKSLRLDLKVDLDQVKTLNGDFNPQDLAKAIDTTERNECIAQVYREQAVGQTIVFAANVAHAQHLSKHIEGSVVVTGETPNREQIIKDFTARKFKCLINCMVFTEGTDMPLIETVIIARPTCNPSLYTQMVGRGLRLSEGKTETLVIDCVGVSKKHSLCAVPHLFNVDCEMTRDHEDSEPQGTREEKAPLLLPAFNKELVDINIVDSLDEGLAGYRDYCWFFTCKNRKTHEVVTKILYTEDIDNAVYKVRKTGFTFVTVISYTTALKLASGDTRRVKMVYDNLSKLASIEDEDVEVPEFFQALLAIEAEGKVNDNITWDMIRDYVPCEDEVEEAA